ncbi:hematopoietic SH2 domain-containing protein homolog isoform X2 [Limanda limanda]|nr:hematopoietic SH2 domain-containing protein homolog isoform X2 [Limanda limanda]XP_060934593.1 hematopoietic SH2 domain-containing protein homolog isoform X2 [Limanda limanda]XP_060934594.1 hematopoietic SH2 domain-containing protein homolog isoform X2 [Limanda limanda]XP_060934595.1 hematopoietic SH2 domain-containing protein homolog isoform X2 [Limanda limanda]
MMERSQLSQGQHDPRTWFTESQYRTVIRNGIIPEWFHGIISRKAAEDLLMPKPAGYFLIRVSETRVGYSLSYRADDRCRHFMIDALEEGDYIIVGESRHHRFLQDLVDFHRRSPILPFTEVLTVACGQSSNDKSDYAELLFPQRRPNPNPSLQHTSLQRNVSPPEPPQEFMPPAPPSRPDNLWTNAVLVPSSQQKYQYSLEFSHNTSQLPAMIPTAEDPQYNLPPGVPPRGCVPPPRQNQPCFGSAPALEGPSSPTAPQHSPIGNIQPGKNHDGKPSVVTNLMNLKKKFQKKRSKSQENLYTEINGEAIYSNANQGEQTSNEAVYSNRGTYMMATHGALPPEYMPPPPFAPGF